MGSSPPFFEQTVDTVKKEANATAPQDMKIVIATEIEIIETETGIATAVGDGMTDVSHLERDTAVETMMTIRDVLPIMKMTAAGTTVDTGMKTVVVDTEVDEVDHRGTIATETGGDVAKETKMGWVLPSEGRQHLKVLSRFRKGGERPPDGISLLPDTNNIPLCKPSKLVSSALSTPMHSLTFTRPLQPPRS